MPLAKFFPCEAMELLCHTVAGTSIICKNACVSVGFELVINSYAVLCRKYLLMRGNIANGLSSSNHAKPLEEMAYTFATPQSRSLMQPRLSLPPRAQMAVGTSR